MIFASTDNNKEVLKNFAELSDEIKNQTETIIGNKHIEYGRHFMKIKFELDDDLPLGIILNILVCIIAVEFVFQGNSKYHAQVYLHECLYEFVNELSRAYNSCKIYIALR